MSTAPTAPSPSPRLGLLAGRSVAAIWLIGFATYFLFQVLPNASTAGRPLTRVEFAKQAAPGLLLDCILPGHEESSSGWRYFPQRFDLLLVGLAVIVGTWCLGSLLFHLISRGASDVGEDRAGRFGAAGLLGLAAWSLITLGLGLCGFLKPLVFGSLLAAFIAVEVMRRFRISTAQMPGSKLPWWRRRFFTGSLVGPICVVVLAPFVMAMLLGSLLPPTDFDVKAYHLVGPKEWFQQGRITYLPHNVYTSFPFLTEMLCLSTMVLRGDWYRGGLAGQLVLASFSIFAAALVFSSARRIAGHRAGWLAAVVYLTTPWICRLSIIAYVEGGLAAYLVAAFWSMIPDLTSPETTNPVPTLSPNRLLLCGLFAGSAAACKYTGVISAVLPLGVMTALLTWRTSWSSVFRNVAIYGLGVAVAFGPWLLKNVVQTGNPVYPLLWGLFGGGEFDTELAAKFKAGHPLPVSVLTSPSRWIPDLWAHLRDVAVGSDWQSLLVFGLLPASLLAWFALSRPGVPVDEQARSRRRGLVMTSAFAAWLFLTWWGLTHRIDRFWVPMLPILSVLSGIGADQLLGSGRSPASLALAAMSLVVGVAAVVFNLGFDVSPLVGFNGFLMDETTARRIAEPQSIELLNNLPPDSRTLLVGEAQVFDCRRDVIYNTVFNRCLFEEWFAAAPNTSGERLLRAPDEIREELGRRGVTHVFVNWLELLRYRTTYGYTPFVTPENVEQLVADGILDRVPLPSGMVGQDVATLPGDQQQDLQGWGKSLIIRDHTGVWFPAYQVFSVRKD